MFEPSPSARSYKKITIGLIGLVAIVGVAGFLFLHTPREDRVSSAFQLQHQEFESFMERFNKFYATEEERLHRMRVFLDNAAYIRVFNMMRKDWTLGINEYADLTAQEFREKKMRFSHTPRPLSEEAEYFTGEGLEVPVAIDWRTLGAVTPVKDQGQCGSCWAFSTTGSVEGAWQIKGNTLISLSEQQLVDCSTGYGNYGCGGGLMDNAFKYIIDNKGITTESNYPYVAYNQQCNTVAAGQIAATISSFSDVAPSNKNSLLAAVSLQPVSVAVEADQAAWQYYSGGTVTSNCGTSLDHGVLAVGYNTGASTPYWIVKNSWGTSWGQAGYIQLGISDGSGICGINLEPSFPTV